MVSTAGTNLPPIIVLSKDLLNEVWPTDEAIREIMSLEEQPWGEFHHRASMIVSEVIKTKIPSFDQPEIVPSSYMTVHTIDLLEKYKKYHLVEKGNRHLISIRINI